MTPSPAMDWRSPLVGAAAACTAFAVLCLIAPIQDRFIMAGASAAAAVVCGLLALRAKPPA